MTSHESGRSQRWTTHVYAFLIAVSFILTMARCGGGSGPDLTKTNIDSVIGVAMRGSTLDSSKGVLQLTNTSGEDINDVRLSLYNAQTRQQLILTLTIKSGQTKEIGWMEGWSFEPGETIAIEQIDYSPETYDVYALQNSGPAVRPTHAFQQYATIIGKINNETRMHLMVKAIIAIVIIALLAWLTVNAIRTNAKHKSRSLLVEQQESSSINRSNI